MIDQIEFFHELSNNDQKKMMKTKISEKDQMHYIVKTISITDDLIKINKYAKGKYSQILIHKNLVNSSKILRAKLFVQDIKRFFTSKSIALQSKNTKYDMSIPSIFLKNIISIGKKNISVQRFKGLGEMNADQLWETTLIQLIVICLNSLSMISIIQMKLSKY